MPRKAKSSDEVIEEKIVAKKPKKTATKAKTSAKKTASTKTKKVEVKKMATTKKPKDEKSKEVKKEVKTKKVSEPKKTKTITEKKPKKEAIKKETKKKETTKKAKTVKANKAEKKVVAEKKTKIASKKAPAIKTEAKKKTPSKKIAEKKSTTKTKASKTAVKNSAKDTKTKTTKSSSKTTSKTTSKTSKKTVKTRIAKSNSKASTKEAKTTTTTKKTTSAKNKKVFLPEYYDLPYRYNETVVKILAQTPKKLFVYWDISDKDIKKYLKVFGENFFYETYPVLLIHNQEMDYTFEVQVNDFANCWYVDINDPKCSYTVNLGRKFKDVNNIKANNEDLNDENIDLKNDFLQITNSNYLEVPNDHILFEKLGNKVRYRNVKTLKEMDKFIDTIVSENGNKLKIYDIYEFYKEIYKNEIEENIFDINNPSSGNTSSKIQFR